uniref:SfiI-subtelomeric related protein family member, putative n=1 Tax=Theileria annulata TaxID=5874 RepID=A0A3B0NDL5_THEAN
MKRWIITLNLLFYITILNQWNGAESNPTSSSTGSPTSGTAAVDSGSTESTPAATTLTHNGTESISTTPDATQSSDTATTSATPIALDLNTSQSTNEFDYTDQNGVVTFKPNSGYVFSKVSQGTKMVWESTNNVHASLVRTKSKDNKKYLALFLTNNMFKVYQLEGNEWKDITSMRRDVTKLRFFSENDVELSSTDYTVSINYFSYEFIFNDGVKCKMIKYGDHEVWKPTDDTKFKMIKKFRLGLVTNSFFVLNESDSKQVAIKVSVDIFKTESTDEFYYIKDLDFRTYTPKPGHVFNKISHGTIDIWKSKNNLYATLICIKPEGDLKYLAMLFQDNMFKLFHEQEDKPWDNITKDRHDVTKLRFLREGDTEITSSHYTLILVDLSYTYIFNSGVTCKKITYNNTPLWSHTDDTAFASLKSLQLDLAKDKFFVKNSSDQLKELDFKTTPETQTTPITLDIEKTETTDEYSYSDQNGLVTYTPKDNHVFNKISQGTKDIWDSGDDVYSTLVMTKVDENNKYLAMLLNNNTFKLFQLENNEWTNITAKRHDITRLKFLGDNDVDLMFTDYTVTLVDLSYTYSFKSGVSCKKIKLGDDEVWSHSDDTNYADIRSFSLGLTSNKFFVKNSSDQSKELNAVTETPDEDDGADDQDDDGTIEEDDDDKSDTTSICSEFTESSSADTTDKSAVTKVTLDLNATQSTDQFDYTDKSEVITYTPKDNHVFTKVSKGTKEIWKSKNNVNGTLVMIKSDDNKKYLAILLDNNTFKLFNYDNDKWNDITKDRHDIKKLKFFGDNDAVITTSDYKVSIIDLSYQYKFNSGVKCRKIKFGDVPIWTHNEDPDYSEIKSLSLDLLLNKFFVTNTSDQTKQVSKPIITTVTLDIDKTESTDEYDYTDRIDLITYKSKDNNLFNKITQGTKEIWKSKNNILGTLVKIKTQDDGKYLVILLQNNSFVLLKLSDIPWKDITSEKHDIAKLKLFGDNDAELSKTDYKVTISYLSYKFTFNSGVKCRKIKYSDLDVWTHTDDKDFESLMSFHQDLLTNKLYVMNSSYKTKEVGIKITLDISKSKDTDQFNYLKNGNFRTYTPKPGYLFSKIVKKPLVGSGVEIWESKEDDQALKAVLIGSKKNSKYLSILIQSGTFVLLFKSGKGKNWVNVTSERPDVTKLKFLFENDIELYSSDYDRILFEPTYGYKFNDGVNCKYITYSGEFVWKHTDDPKFESILSFYLDLPNNKLFVKNSSNEIMQVGVKVTLDIKNTQDTHHYYYSKDADLVTYNPKAGYLFNKVVDGTKPVWQSQRGLYGTLVRIISKGVKYLAILMINNEFVCLKLTGLNWVDITSKRPDLKKLKFLKDNDTEITESDYEVTLENDSYTIIFDEDVKCKKITYDDRDAWNHTDDTKFSEIKSFQLGIASNQFYVTNSSDQTKQVGVKVTLDIEKTQSTDQFDYTDANGLVTYTPKSGYLINKVSNGSTNIWESKNDVYGTLVRTNTKDVNKYLAMLLTDNTFSLFKESDGTWKDITSQRFNVSNLKFLGENDTELKSSDFKVTLVDYFYTYIFNEDVNCKKIKYGDSDVWSHTDDPDFSDIKSLSLDLPTNKFSVTNQSDETKPVDVKVTLNLNSTQSTTQFDYTDENGLVTYTPKPSHIFSKVSQGTKDIWESKDDVHGTIVRSKIYDNKKFLALLLENSLFKVFHLVSGEWTEITSKRPDVTKLKFLGDNDTELTSSDYKVLLVDLLFTYLFNPGVNCRKVKYDGRDLWTHTDDQNFQSIKSLHLDLPTNKFYVTNTSDQKMQVGVKVSLDIDKTESTDDYEYLKDDDCHTFSPKPGNVFSKVSQGTTDIWESTDCVFGSLVRTKVSKDVKYLSILLTNDMFKVFHLDDNEWNDVTSMRRDITKLKFLGENNVELSKTDYTVTIVNYSYQFKFNDGVSCKMITYCDDDVWKDSDDPKYSEIRKFQLGLVSNNFFVLNASEFKKVGIKICLDIDKTESTEKYYFNDKNGLKTYTPNFGYVFNKVSDGTKDVWNSKDNIHGTLVRIMIFDNKKFLVVLLDNNTFLLFNLDDDKWKDITSDRRDVTKLKFYGENDSELKSSDYKVTLENDSFTYLFNDGVKCKMITYSDLDVWKHTDDTNYSDIKSLSLGLPTNKLYVTNTSDHSKQVDVKVTLNMEKTQSTDHFDHSKDDKFHTYTPKSDYVFNKIIKKGLLTSSVDIWESKDDLCGTLVVTKDESGLLAKDKHLAILLQNNTFVLLHSSDKGKNWNDLTSQRYDVSNLKFFDEKDNELSPSDYSVSLVNLSYQHKFNDSVNCKNITYDDITIWKNTDDKDYSEIKLLQLDLLSNKFSVMNSNDKKELKDITMVALDIQKTQSTNEFDFTEQSGVITYTAKSSHVFNKVSQGTTVIWESSNDIQCTLATITSVESVKYLSLLLKDNTFKLFKQDAGTWNDIISERHDITKLKFLGENDTELKSSDYTVTLAGDSYQYNFKDSVKCKNITFDNMPVWSHTDDQDFSEIRSFSLDLPTNKLYVTNTSDQKKQLDIKVSLDIEKTQSTDQFDFSEQNGLITYTPKDSYVFSKLVQGTKDIWESKDSVFGILVMSKTLDDQKFLAILLSDNMFTLFNEDDNEWKDLTKDRLDITNLKFLGDNDTPLKPSDLEVTLQDLSYEYKFNEDVSCNKIKYGDLDVWTHSDDTDFSDIKSFSLDLPKNKFNVTNSNDETKQVDIKVTLDVNATQSTSEFQYTEDNGVITFITKDSHVFNKVVEGTKDIWESTNNVHATLVISKTLDDVKYLALFLTNNMFTLFDLESDGTWHDITSQRLDISKLKFLGENDTPITSSHYTVSLSNLLFTYKFNTDVKCVMITYNDNPLWTHTDDPEFAEIKSLLLNLPTNKLYVTNTSDKSKQVDIKVSVDLNVTQSTNEFDFTDQNGLFTYKPKDNHVFIKISQGNTPVWQSSDGVCSNLVMTKTLYNVKFLAVLMTNNMFTLFKEDSSNWTNITSDRLDISKLKFLGDGNTELKPSDYTVSLSNFSYTYLFNSGVFCKNITYADNLLWSPTDDPEFADIKSLQLNLPTNKFSVTNLDDQTKDVDIKVLLDLDTSHSTDEFYYSDQNDVITYTPKSSHVFSKLVDGATDIWESKPGLYGSLVMSNTLDDVRFLVMLLTDNTFKLFKLSRGSWADITSEKYDLTKLKFLGENDTELKASDYEVDLVDLSYQYKFNEDAKCRNITYDDNDVWTHTYDKDFSEIKSIALDFPKNKFIITNSNDESKELTVKVDLDVNATQSTSQFDYTDQNGLVTFTPKDGFVLNKIVEGTKDIWESTDDVYGSLVMSKIVDNDKYLAILLTDNTFKVFHEESDEWHDLTNQRHDVTNLKFLGESDTEIKSSDLEVSLVDFSICYSLDNDFMCRKIMYGDDELWTHTDDAEFADIKSLSLDLPNNKFNVTNTSNNKKELDIKVTLDIANTHSTDDFDFTEHNGVTTFTPKSDHVFTKVTQSDNLIWESTNNVHATLVMNKSEDNKRFLVILLDNNMFKLFHLENNEWTDITIQKHNINKLKFFGENDTELSKSDFEVTLQDLSYEYKFNPGVNCKKITYNDNLLWNHNEDQDYSEIKSLQLDLPKNKFSVMNSNDETKEVDIKVTLDLEKTEPTNEFEYTDHNDVVTYKPKDNHVFNKVSQGTTSIWQSSDGVFGTLVMSKTSKDVKYLAMLMNDNMFKLFKEEDNKWNDITSQRSDLMKLKFLGNNDTPLIFSDFTLTLHDLSYTYTFNTGVNCRKIMYGNNDVWTHIDDPKFASLKSLSLDLPSNKLYVTNTSDQKKEVDIKVSLDINVTQSTDEFDFADQFGLITFTPKDNHVFSKVSQGSTGIWESKDSVFGILVMSKTLDDKKYLAVLLTNHSFKLFNEESGKFNDITPDRYDITKLKFLGENDAEITKSDYKVDLVDLSYEYNFNEDTKCKKITYNNSEVWNHTYDKDFSELKSIALDLPSNKFSVTNTSDQSLPVDIKVTLNIQRTESTDEYDFNDQSGLFTFIPKDNHVFIKVTEGTKDIWQSKNNLYGILVVTKTVENDKYLAMLLTNNMFLLFHQDQDGNWANITAMRHDIKKLKFLDDTNNPLSNSDYTVTIVDLSYQYKFKDGVKCHTVKLGEGDLWKHSDDSDFSEIKSFQLDLPTNKFSVTNLKDESIQLSKARVPLDIENTHSTNECHYSYDHDIHTFTPKPNYVFTKVTQGTKDVCESKTDFYGTLAKLKSMDEGNKKYLLVLQDNNTFKLFHEVSGQWHDITSKRHDLTKLKFLRDGNTEITSSDYSVGIVDYSYEYKFNTGVRCKKIKLGEEELWKHSDDTEFQSIKSFSLDLLMNKFFIKNSTDKTKQLGITVNVDIPKLLITPKFINVSQTPQPESAPTQTQTAPTSTTPTPSTTTQTPETPETPEAEATPESTSETAEATSQTSQTLQAKSTYEPVYQTLTAKSDNLFDKVSDGNTVVWESNDDVCGTMVSIKSDRKEIHLAVLLQDNDFVLVHKDNKDDTWKDVTSERADVTNLKFLDDTDTELSPSDYTVTIVDLSYEHEFNEGVICKKVTHGEDEVWSHRDDTKFSEIKKLSLDLPSNKFSITNLNDQRKELTTTFTRVSVEIKKKDPNRQYDYSKSSNFHKFTPKAGNLFTKVSKGSDVVWDSKVEYVTLVNIKTEQNHKYLSMLLQNNTFVLLQKSDNEGDWKNITSERYDIKKLKFLGDNDNPLTKNDYTTTIADCSYRFKFNTGVICKTIKYGDDDVWKHDDTNFSEITVLDLNLTNNKFSVTNNQSNSKELDYNGPITPAETTPADTSKPKLSLPKLPGSKSQTQTASTKPVPTPSGPTKNKLITLDIDKTESTDDYDYTDKNGVVTFTTKDNHVFSKLVDGTKVVWQSKPVLYGTELMYIESVKYLVVQLQDNTFKLFVHFAGIWTDITHKRYDIKKLKFLGDNDTELTSSDYKITIFRFFYTFTFNDAVKCKKITYGKDDVWKHSDDTEYSEIKKFQIGLASNESFVFNNKLKSKILDYKPETTKSKPKSETPEDDDTTPQETTDTKLPDTKESSDDSSTTPTPDNTKPVTILTVDIDKTESTDYYDYILEH